MNCIFVYTDKKEYTYIQIMTDNQPWMRVLQLLRWRGSSGNQFFKGKNNNSVICTIVGVDHNIYRFQKWHRIKNIYTEEALEDSEYLNQLSLPV